MKVCEKAGLQTVKFLLFRIENNSKRSYLNCSDVIYGTQLTITQLPPLSLSLFPLKMLEEPKMKFVDVVLFAHFNKTTMNKPTRGNLEFNFGSPLGPNLNSIHEVIMELFT